MICRMDERVMGAVLLLGAAEREFGRLGDSLRSSNRLAPGVKHDLANAVALVVGFRELLDEPDEEALVDEAHQALRRAWEIVTAVSARA
jgi:hypothetical protein